MKLFGNPKYPRRSIAVGAITLAGSSFLLGTAFEHMFSAEITTKDWIDLVIWLVLFGLAIVDIRHGISSLPADPKDPKIKPLV